MDKRQISQCSVHIGTISWTSGVFTCCLRLNVLWDTIPTSHHSEATSYYSHFLVIVFLHTWERSSIVAQEQFLFSLLGILEVSPELYLLHLFYQIYISHHIWGLGTAKTPTMPFTSASRSSKICVKCVLQSTGAHVYTPEVHKTRPVTWEGSWCILEKLGLFQKTWSVLGSLRTWNWVRLMTSH